MGRLTIDVAARRVFRDDLEVQLTRREYALLEYLARRAGQVVNRMDIANTSGMSGTTSSRTWSTSTSSVCAANSMSPESPRSSAPAADMAISYSEPCPSPSAVD